MELKNFFAQDEAGNILSGATCYVYLRGTESVVGGLKKANGTALANPFTTDQYGSAEFVAPNGLYDVRVIKGSRDFRVRMQFNDVTETVQAANAAAERSEVARDAALLAKGLATDIADGLKKTVNGEYFTTPSMDNKYLLILYRNTGGAAIEMGRYSSAGFVASIGPEIYDQAGRAPMVLNLFDLSRTIDGYYVDTVGGATADPAYYISDFVPVMAGQKYCFSLAVSAIAFYGPAKEFIAHQGNIASADPFTVPVNAQFVRFSKTLSTGKAKQMLIKGEALPAVFVGFGYRDPASQDRKTHAAALTMVKDAAVPSANLFDLSRVTEGSALAISGDPYPIANYWVSNHIPIKGSTSYVLSTGSGVLCFYDADKVKLSNITAASGVAFISPAEACFIRFQMTPLNVKNTLMLVEGAALPGVYAPFGSPSLKKVLEASRAAVDAAQPLVRNLFDPARAQVDKAITAVNGAIYTQAGYFITGRIPVTPSSYFVSLYGTNSLVFYDIEGNFLSGSTAFGSFANTPIPVPAGAYSVQFQGTPVSRIAALMVTSGSAVPAGYIPFGGLTSKLPWQDKKLVILGDSISETGLYVSALLAGTGMSLLANHAKAGRPVREMGKTKAGVDLSAEDLASADLVLAPVATNDYGGGRALGAIADAYSGSVLATFYNDVYQLLTRLYTLKPTIRVVLCTPLKRGAFESQPVYPAANNVGAKLDQYANAIIEVCELFAVPVCDLFRVGGFKLMNLSAYTGDNLHPNAAGVAFHVRPMIAAINAC